MKAKIIYKACVGACFILFIVSFLLSDRQPRQITELLGDKKKAEFQLQRNYFSELGDVVVYNDEVYILYKSMGVIEKYDLNGNYLKSYAYRSKGRSSDSFVVEESGVWLKTDMGDVFLLHSNGQIEEKNLESYFEAEEENYKNHKEWEVDSTGAVYKKRLYSVYKTTADGKQGVFVRRPFYCFFAEYSVVIGVVMVLLLCIVGIILKRRY